MSAVPHNQRLKPGHREERKKKPEVFVARKTSFQKQSDRRPDVRSPLMERSNRDLQKKSEKIKTLKKKMAEPVNKENIRPPVNKDGKSVTLTQSFLKTKTLKEKQLKDDKTKLETTNEPPKPLSKPVLGAYRGKIVQSKINSFRTNSEKNKTMDKSQVKRPLSNVSVPAKMTMRPPANDVRPKRPIIPPVSSQTRPSTTLPKSKVEPAAVRRTTLILTQRGPIHQRPQQAQPDKPPLKTAAVKNNTVVASTKKSSGAVKTLPEPQNTKTAPKVPTDCKFPKVKESAEERRARLAQWRQSKGIFIKRPSMAVVQPSTHKQKPEIKSEPEEPKRETRQLYWAALAEEDEQMHFTRKVNQIFKECQKLIDEGCPRDEVLSLLEKQMQTLPEAKKLSGYWECLVRLEKRDGDLDKVIEVCEQGVATCAQPSSELKVILAEAMEQLKPVPGESVKKENEDDLKSEEINTEVKDEPEEKPVKGKKRRGKARAVKHEPTSPSTSDKPPRPECTPGNGTTTSSVIRFNIRATPQLEKMKQQHINEGESSIQSYKFLTPVRRSSRLERKSHRLPDMLKDHDPCVAGIDQLQELEDSDTCANAYILRKNRALDEVSAKSASKKGVSPED
ncbi:hypothetical protein GDO81_004875 [Engystomops pustulosus]|uniref:Cytoskeleton-associated protein 2 C-terminal domain-containing protein n=1 Tax=Engystomops pustulosus TaxID=76066 RepID=A0AAV7CJ81_ENGPU|nr:hypothetical protein GDO81_004875 [Engystomops pustulosus]